MLLEITCAFVNEHGNIEMHTNTFACKTIELGIEQAKEYFPEAYCNGSDYIYSKPSPTVAFNKFNLNISNARNIQIGDSTSVDMVQVNHGKARGVQINGNASHGTTIITGDKVGIRV